MRALLSIILELRSTISRNAKAKASFALVILLNEIVLLVLCSCGRVQQSSSVGTDTTGIASSRYNDVYDQGRTEGCWVYAMVACIEHEQQRYGDTLCLSRQWLLSKVMEEQTRLCLANPDHHITMRGVGPDALRLVSKYGLIPQHHEKSVITNGKVLGRRLMLLARRAVSQHMSDQQFVDEMEHLLPQFSLSRGTPPHFYYYSMRYDPYQFAESIMYHQSWQWYASVPYHPYGKPFVLEVADNFRHHRYINLTPKQLLGKVLASLKKGHPVYWEMAWNPEHPEGKPVPSQHAMAIVGLRKGKDGKPRLLCLNSWGRKWGNNGYCLVTTDYFLRHTCNVGVHTALPPVRR